MGTTIMGPVMYRPPGALMASSSSFPPNLTQPTAPGPLRVGQPTAAARVRSHAKGRKLARQRRRSKSRISSEEEESSPSPDESDSDLAGSGMQDSDGAVSAARLKRQRAGRAASPGPVAKQDEEDFLGALTKFWEGQASAGRKVLAKYRPFESIRLSSGMRTFSAHQLWAAVMAIGGHSRVCNPGIMLH